MNEIFQKRTVYLRQKNMNSMSESEGQSNDWEKLWQDYSKSLENWKQLFESVQKANAEMQEKFNQVMEKAVKEMISLIRTL